MGDSGYFLRDHSYVAGWTRYQQDEYLSFLVNLLGPRKNELVLDDGSGNGRFSLAMVRKGSKVVLLDINRRLLKKAVENLRREDVANNTMAVLGDIQNLPFKGDVFNKVLCVHNLWYVPDYGKAVGEMLRTLREGGGVVIDHLNLLNWRIFVNKLVNVVSKILQRNPSPIFYRTPGQILRPLRGFQFDVWSLASSKEKNLPLKGEKAFAARLIVKCAKLPVSNLE